MRSNHYFMSVSVCSHRSSQTKGILLGEIYWFSALSFFFVGPSHCQAQMYAVVSYALVSHGEYADGIDRQTDGRQTVTSRFPLEAASVPSSPAVFCWPT